VSCGVAYRLDRHPIHLPPSSPVIILLVSRLDLEIKTRLRDEPIVVWDPIPVWMREFEIEASQKLRNELRHLQE